MPPPLELRRAVEEPELDQEREADDPGPEVLDQLHGRGGRPPGGEDVVDDQHPVPGLEGVLVDLDGLGPVLELVRDRATGRRQLPGLPRRDEPGPEVVGDGGGCRRRLTRAMAAQEDKEKGAGSNGACVCLREIGLDDSNR